MAIWDSFRAGHRRASGSVPVDGTGGVNRRQGVLHAVKQGLGQFRRWATKGNKDVRSEVPRDIDTGHHGHDDYRPLSRREAAGHPPIVSTQLPPDALVPEETEYHPLDDTVLPDHLPEPLDTAQTEAVPQFPVDAEEPEPDIPDHANHDEFIQDHIEPLLKKSRRNIPEKLVGWLAGKVLKKYLPVDEQETNVHQKRITQLQEQIKEQHDKRDTLLTTQKKLRVGLKKQNNAISDGVEKVGWLAQQIAEKESKIHNLPERDKGSKTEGKLHRTLAELKTEKDIATVALEKAMEKGGQIEQHLTDVSAQVEAVFTKELQLIQQQNDVKQEQVVAEKQQQQFNHNLVSMVLNLRQLYQGNTAFGAIQVPHLKIPVGEGHLDLNRVSFQPSAIVTRMENGMHYVDITVKNVKASVIAPLEEGATADVDIELDNIKLVLGGPVAEDFHKYLNCSGRTMALHLGKLVTGLVRGFKGKKAEAPVHVGAEIGRVKVRTPDTNASTLVKGVTMGRRSPDSSIHKLIANLRLPVEVKVHHLDVATHGEVQAEAEIDELAFRLDPNVSETAQEGQRRAQLGVSAKRVRVGLDGPIGLAAYTVQQALPPDPVQSLPGPLGVLSYPRLLERLPESACTRGDLELEGLDVSLGRNVNQRTAKVSPNEPVWFVEGDTHSRVTARKVGVKTQGNLELNAQFHNVELNAKTLGTGVDQVRVSVAPQGGDGVAAEAGLVCKPDFMRSMADASGSERLHKLLVDGQGTARLVGPTVIDMNKRTGAVETTVGGAVTEIDKPVLVKTEGFHLRLPKSIQAGAGGVHVTSQPETDHRGLKQKRTEVTLDRVDVEGDGDVVVETGFSATGEPKNHFVIPIRGRGSMTGTRVEDIRLSSSEKHSVRHRTVLHPGKISIKDVRSNDIRVDRLQLQLNDELDGDLRLEGAGIRFNDLVEDRARFSRDDRDRDGAVDIIDPVPLPRLLRRVLRNRVLSVTGAVPVVKGSIDVRELATTRLRLTSEKPNPGVGSRLVTGGLNLVIRGALFILGGKVLRLELHNDKPILRSPLLRQFSMPLPEIAGQHLTLNENGSINIAATQHHLTGLYCLPQKRQHHLDLLLNGVLSERGSVARLDEVMLEVEKALQQPSTVQEALYLLKGLPVETLVKDAERQPGIKAGLERVVAAALQHPGSRAVAVEIYCRGSALGIQPNRDLQIRLAEDIKENDSDATDFAEMLYNLSRVSEAVPRLLKIIEKDRDNARALLLLARIEWSRDLYDEALIHIRDASMAANESQDQTVHDVLNAWIEGAENPNRHEIFQARHLSATLILRKEVVRGDEASFLSALKALEELAMTDDVFGIDVDARKTLVDRCRHSYQIHEELELEDWQVWQDKVAKTVGRVRAGRVEELSDDDLYSVAISLMYCHKGVNPDLNAARMVLDAIDPATPQVQLHLGILDELQKPAKHAA